MVIAIPTMKRMRMSNDDGCSGREGIGASQMGLNIDAINGF
jgi:hypothetical protein